MNTKTDLNGTAQALMGSLGMNLMAFICSFFGEAGKKFQNQWQKGIKVHGNNA